MYIIINEFTDYLFFEEVTQPCYVIGRDIRGSHNLACGLVGSLNHDLLRIGPLDQHHYHHHLSILVIVISCDYHFLIFAGHKLPLVIIKKL